MMSGCHTSRAKWFVCVYMYGHICILYMDFKCATIYYEGCPSHLISHEFPIAIAKHWLQPDTIYLGLKTVPSVHVQDCTDGKTEPAMIVAILCIR